MKKSFFILVLVLLVFVAVLASGCGRQPDSGTMAADRVLVYATIYPLADFAGKIGGERVEVVAMVPPGVEPHDWEPGPQMLAGLSRASLLIYNGFGMEPWLDKVADSIDSGVVLLNASAGIEPLLGYAGHDDDHDDYDDHDEDDAGDKIPDPHVWLDPLLAMQQAETIAAALADLDPQYAAVYSANAADFCRRIEELDEAYRRELSGLEGRAFVVTHLSFAYLARRYNLQQLGISGLSPQAEPSPAQMKEVVDLARKYGISHVFQEPLTSSRLAAVLAAEISAELLTLNPLEGLSAQQQEAGEDYFSVMFDNLAQLKIALK